MNHAPLPETGSVGVERIIIVAVEQKSVDSATLVVCKFLHRQLDGVRLLTFFSKKEICNHFALITPRHSYFLLFWFKM